MLELTGTSLLAISTPLDEFNFYSKLVELKDDKGRPFFKTIRAGRICQDCLLLPNDEMLKCDHVPDGAHWKSQPKLKRLKVIFRDDEARGLNELGGIIASNFVACFQKRDIETLFLAPPRVTRAMPDALIITIDPNGGGPSKLGIISGYHDGCEVVVSLFFVFFPLHIPFLFVDFIALRVFGLEIHTDLERSHPGYLTATLRRNSPIRTSILSAHGRGTLT